MARRTASPEGNALVARAAKMSGKDTPEPPADVAALQTRVAGLEAETRRLQAEVETAQGEVRATRLGKLRELFAARGRTFSPYASDVAAFLSMSTAHFNATMDLLMKDPKSIPQHSPEAGSLVAAARSRKH